MTNRLPALVFLIVAVALAVVGFRWVELAAATQAPLRVTGVFLMFAVYAGTLAAYVAWRLPHRVEARYLALSFAVTALTLAAAVTPTGTAGFLARAVLSVGSMVALAFVILFASRFPRPLVAEDFRGAPPETSSRVVRLIDRALDPVARLFVTRPLLVWALLSASVVLNYFLTGPDIAYRYNLIFLNARSPLMWMASIRGLAFLVTAVFPVALVWSGYRRGTPESRRQAHWIVLGALFFLFWLLLTLALHLLSRSIDAPLVQLVGRWSNQVSLQVMFFVVITAPFVALLFGGAMDLKPVIHRTSLYGLMLLTMTGVFAGVEELVSSQVTRLALPEGTGSWLGAMAVALVMLPLQDRLRAWLKRVGDD